MIERFGRIDAAFNNAGIEGAPAATHECTLENWTRTIDINLRGIWLCMKHEIPHMLKQESGSIVNCASIAGLVGFANLPAYTASKHGVIGLTRTAALEYARQGLRINAVCPGVIDTPMVQRFTQGNAEALDQLTSGEPVGRLGKPEEIGDAVIWLCSPRSSFVKVSRLASKLRSEAKECTNFLTASSPWPCPGCVTSGGSAQKVLMAAVITRWA